MRFPSILSLVGVSLALSQPACVVKECNLMYAPDALDVQFDPVFSAEGAWVVTLGGDVDATCTVTLPLADDGAPDCDLGEASLVISEDRTSIEGVSLFGLAPEHVTVELSHEGVAVLSVDLTPTYEVDEPNGEGCGERHSAVVVVDTTADSGA